MPKNDKPVEEPVVDAPAVEAVAEPVVDAPAVEPVPAPAAAPVADKPVEAVSSDVAEIKKAGKKFGKIGTHKVGKKTIVTK